MDLYLFQLSAQDSVQTGLVKTTLFWLVIFGIIRTFSELVPDQRIKYSRDSFAYRVCRLLYNSFCIIIGSQQFPTLQTYVTALYQPPLDDYISLGVTSNQTVCFFMSAGYVIADGIIRHFHGTFGTNYIIHHVIFLIAYGYGGLIRKQFGWGLLVHLIIGEWRDVVFVVIKMLEQIRSGCVWLHYADGVCVTLLTLLMWKFEYNVCVMKDLDVVYKVPAVVMIMLLAQWTKGRLQWNRKKIQAFVFTQKTLKIE